ncbi:hypothetical protein HMPREF0548_1931 [Lactobacillus ultunensis DSM 16047]|uniref:Uncharacterized protein n=1 Tax=Lactobacillus ultunensis DSM 16047 TaxID=525365 RepID=C2EQI5_9LACO|nr:hypothetical protein HMPREF0548_1931 [Lactobacillus ultunensis DSM 16047]
MFQGLERISVTEIFFELLKDNLHKQAEIIEPLNIVGKKIVYFV